MQITSPSRLRATPLGVAAIAVAVTAWSLSNVIVKIVHTSAPQLAFWRLWIGSAVMLGICLAARRRLAWSDVRDSAPAGVLFGVQLVLFLAAFKHTNLADVLIIAALQPGLVMLVAGRLFGERVTRQQLFLVVCSIVGIFVFVRGSSQTPTWTLEGDLLAVAALVIFTAYFVLSKRLRQRIQAVQYMMIVTVVAAVVVTPVAMLSGTTVGGLRPQDWAWLVAFVAAAQGSQLLLAWAHREVDATVSSLILLGEPPITAASAYVFLDEPLTFLMIIGGVVVLGSLGVLVRDATTTAAEADPR